MFNFVFTVAGNGTKTITEQKDGTEMVLIPASTFEMGATKNDPSPRHF